MKKLLLVLLVLGISIYLFAGCVPVTPPPAEGEGESEVTVVIDGAVVLDGKTYVSAGTHEVVVTFPAPVPNWVDGYLSSCDGYYGTGAAKDSDFVLFPDATKKIWTGMVNFYDGGSDCCAAYLELSTGACEETTCIWFPVIVDAGLPYAEIEITVDNCSCAGCAINFASTSSDPECTEGVLCCGDDCSGLASWSITLYDANPFDTCCDPSVCEEPVYSCSGVDCPIDCTTECLTEGTYWAIVNLVDNVGLEDTYVAKIFVSGGATTSDTCEIVVEEWSDCEIGNPSHFVETTDTIGSCDLVS